MLTSPVNTDIRTSRMSQPGQLNKTCNLTSNNFTGVTQTVVNLDQHVITVCPETGELQMDANSRRGNHSHSDSSLKEQTSSNAGQSIIVVCPKTGEVRQKIITLNNQESLLKNNNFTNNKARGRAVVNLDHPIVAVCTETGEVQSRGVSKDNDEEYDYSDGDPCENSDVAMDSDSSCGDDSSECEQADSDLEATHKSFVELVTDSQSSTSGLPPKMLCTTCGESFRCADMFQRHKCIDITKKTCELCDYEYLTNKQYHIHLKTHIDTGSLKCPLCKKKFKKRPYLLVHLRSHSKHRLYECPYCDKEFIHYNQFKFHEHIHTGVKPYKCKGCDKEFARIGDLKRHEDTHSCNNSTMKAHISKDRQRTNVPMKQHRCKQCGNTFSLLENLHIHEQIHVEQESFTCTYCSLVFRSRSELNFHEAIHIDNTKPYTCGYCAKAFKQRSHLTDHERIHTGVKPHKCPHCDKSFVQRSQLKYHENAAHLGVRPFRCTECGNTYTQHAHLRNHERIHDGVKVYECSVCSKTFIRYGSFKAHEKTHQKSNNSILTESLSQKLHLTVKQLTEDQNLSPQSHLTDHEVTQTQTQESACDDGEVNNISAEKGNLNKQELSQGEHSSAKLHNLQDELSQEQILSMESPHGCKVSQRKQIPPQTRRLRGHKSTYLNAEELKNEKTEHSYLSDTLCSPNGYVNAESTHNEGGHQVVSRNERTHANVKPAQPEDNQTHDHAQEIVPKEEYSPKSSLSMVPFPQDNVKLQAEEGFSQISKVVLEQTVKNGGDDEDGGDDDDDDDDDDEDSLNGDDMGPDSPQNWSSSEEDQINEEQGGEGIYTSADSTKEHHKHNTSFNAGSEHQRLRFRKSTRQATVSKPLVKPLSRPYKCSFCSKAFIQRSHLRDHEYIHKGVKPFKCGFCDKTFTQSGNLRTHERIHTGSKPFACEHCDKAFIQRNHLREHVKVHFEAKSITTSSK